MRDLIPHFEDILSKLADAFPEATFSPVPEVLERDGQYGRLVGFPDDSRFHGRLWADCSEEWPLWLRYSFQLQAGDGSLLFRHDNAPHYPELADFPNHVHVGGGVLTEGAPSLRGLIDRIRATVR